VAVAATTATVDAAATATAATRLVLLVLVLVLVLLLVLVLVVLVLYAAGGIADRAESDPRTGPRAYKYDGAGQAQLHEPPRRRGQGAAGLLVPTYEQVTWPSHLSVAQV